jgi:hypothetical protein
MEVDKHCLPCSAKVRMSRALSLLSPYVSMAWAGTTLLLSVYCNSMLCTELDSSACSLPLALMNYMYFISGNDKIHIKSRQSKTDDDYAEGEITEHSV